MGADVAGRPGPKVFKASTIREAETEPTGFLQPIPRPGCLHPAALSGGGWVTCAYSLPFSIPEEGKLSRKSRVNLRVLAVLVFASSAFGLADEHTCPDHLFVIERSKNKNIVAYDARRGPTGDFESSEPVVAYWLLNGDKDKREELTAIEQDRAYGVEVTPGDSPGTYSMVFKAQRKRHFTLRMLNGCPVVTIPIRGRNAILRKLFVKAKETLVLPKVDYVEFFGEDADTGKTLHEKFKPGQSSTK